MKIRRNGLKNPKYMFENFPGSLFRLKAGVDLDFLPPGKIGGV